MKRIIVWPLLLLIGASWHIQGMEQSNSYDDLLTAKAVIENHHLYKDHLQMWGNQDAHNALQSKLALVKQCFINKGLLAKDEPIFLKYFSPEAMECLKKNNWASWNNSIIYGRKIIHIDPRIGELSDGEQESLLGHELAHAAINRNSLINPHCWMDKLHTGLLLGGFAGTNMSACAYLLAEKLKSSSMSKRASKAFKVTGLAMISWVPITLLSIRLGWMDDNPQSSCGVSYSWLNKTEEALCDIIAARVIPNGGEKGALLYRNKLEHNGNRNGTNGDHPYTQTRIGYHDVLAKIEQC